MEEILNRIDIPQLYDSYKKWVSKNPEFVGDLETTAKWASYFIAGRINGSNVVSELIYSLSNLLVLFNDRIIEKAQKSAYSVNNSHGNNENKLKILLTTLEYFEVFIELSAKQVWGESGRWFFVVVVQIIKCVGRLILTFKHKQIITQSPAIPALNRKEMIKSGSGDSMTGLSHAEKEAYGANTSITFTLKRSGKIMRRIEGAPPIHLRNWKPISDETIGLSSPQNGNLMMGYSGGKRLTLAETLYIVKPILHLSGCARYGLDSWKSYAIAMALDSMSLQMYYQNRGYLSKKQKLELSKRCVAMLLYIMRSPFYDRTSKNKIHALLNAIGNNVPFTNTVCQLLLTYIPHWQSTYFYMWST